LYPKDWKDFAPRFSLADDLLGNGKIVVRTGIGVFYDGASQDFFVGNQPWNTSPAEAGPAFNNIGFAGAVAPTIVAGQPIFSNYSASSAFTVDQNLVTPRYVSYNLNVESQVSKKVAVQIGYVGSQGRHLYHFRDINQVDPTTISLTNQNGTSPYPNYVYINQIETSALSNYNSMQASLKLQNLHGLTSTLNYTWAHSIDTASDGLDFVPNAAQPDNSLNPQAERASSNFDVRQRLQWYWSYALPKFRTAAWLTSGWSLDGMFNFATGQPYTVSYLYEGNFNGSGEFFGRPDIVGDPQVKHGVNAANGAYNLLNASAFVAPCTWDTTLDGGSGGCVPGTQHFGNEGRNAFNSTNYTNFDFTLAKATKLTEKVSMKLQADFFNIFNHANMSNPLLPGFSVDAFANSGTSNFVPFAPGGTQGKIVGSGNPGSNGFVQTSATPDVGSGNPFLGGGGPRTAQLAVHFTF
jgi:hypothetical protein